VRPASDASWAGGSSGPRTSCWRPGVGAPRVRRPAVGRPGVGAQEFADQLLASKLPSRWGRRCPGRRRGRQRRHSRRVRAQQPGPRRSPSSGCAARRSAALTWAGEASGCCCSSSATAPLVTACAWLVPLPRQSRPPTRACGLSLAMHRGGGQDAEHADAAGHDVGLGDARDGVAAAEGRDRPVTAREVRRPDGEGAGREAGVADERRVVAGETTTVTPRRAPPRPRPSAGRRRRRCPGGCS
jgi:hypothetical protein